MQPGVFEILTDRTAREVFKAVVRQRSINFTNLKKVLGQGVDVNVIVGPLTKLKEVGLIAEESAPLKDWATYYVTADGLEAERKLSRLEL